MSVILLSDNKCYGYLLYSKLLFYRQVKPRCKEKKAEEAGADNPNSDRTEFNKSPKSTEIHVFSS